VVFVKKDIMITSDRIDIISPNEVSTKEKTSIPDIMKNKGLTSKVSVSCFFSDDSKIIKPKTNKKNPTSDGKNPGPIFFKFPNSY
jgi:hypothetical protein